MVALLSTGLHSVQLSVSSNNTNNNKATALTANWAKAPMVSRVPRVRTGHQPLVPMVSNNPPIRASKAENIEAGGAVRRDQGNQGKGFR
mmetsp:Transcript_19821/g.31650  ORF Transcript_19821/g.31650 Transcript_19821/m.31650 type:complete len:89 (-) Transcript_19821:158-424(-)